MGRLKRDKRRSKAPIITLLTDFGLHDEYVGVMKGVILTYAPEARLVDLTHLIPPQNIQAAAHVLARAYPYFPSGTVHLAVVDPGVGSSRAILAVASGGQYFVGPDNGVFTPVFNQATQPAVHLITASELFLAKVGRTFHGRDIMAPLAARLACGLQLDKLGPRIPVQDCVHAHPRKVFPEGGRLRGEILHIDHFGNLCTNITREDVEAFAAGRAVVITVGERLILPFCHSYSDQPAGKPLALYDSHEQVEIAVNQGSAARELNIPFGMPIYLSLR